MSGGLSTTVYFYLRFVTGSGERLPFPPSLLDNGQLVGPVQGVFGAQSADVKLGQSTERTGKKMNGVRSAGMCAFVMLCCYIEVVIIEVLLHSSARFKLNIHICYNVCISVQILRAIFPRSGHFTHIGHTPHILKSTQILSCCLFLIGLKNVRTSKGCVLTVSRCLIMLRDNNIIDLRHHCHLYSGVRAR